MVQRSLKELGLAAGAALPLVFEAAQDHGLDLCPADTGPYLRLAWRTQPNAPDAIMSNGRAPTGSVTVAASVLREEDEYPKGFYLRVIDHRLWLRGYRCDLAYAWDPDDSFVFALPHGCCCATDHHSAIASQSSLFDETRIHERVQGARGRCSALLRWLRCRWDTPRPRCGGRGPTGRRTRSVESSRLRLGPDRATKKQDSDQASAVAKSYVENRLSSQSSSVRGVKRAQPTASPSR